MNKPYEAVLLEAVSYVDIAGGIIVGAATGDCQLHGADDAVVTQGQAVAVEEVIVVEHVIPLFGHFTGITPENQKGIGFEFILQSGLETLSVFTRNLHVIVPDEGKITLDVLIQTAKVEQVLLGYLVTFYRAQKVVSQEGGLV